MQKRSRADKTLSDLTKRNVRAIADIEAGAESLRGKTGRFAEIITRVAGSMYFVYFHVAWFSAWVALNSTRLVPAKWRIDPFPFTFLTFVVSLEAIFLSAFILITQKHEERLAERRSHLDLQINLLAEQENAKMLSMLEAIQSRLGISHDDPELAALEEPTSAARLLDQIEDDIG